MNISTTPPPWIDCKEQLPAIGQQVMAYVPYFSRGNIAIREREQLDCSWGWKSPGERTGSLGPNMVTHWIPLEWSAGDIEFRSWELVCSRAGDNPIEEGRK